MLMLYIVNENSSSVRIDEIRTDNEIITLNIEGFEYLGNDEYLENIILIILPPKVTIKLSINLLIKINEKISI